MPTQYDPARFPIEQYGKSGFANYYQGSWDQLLKALEPVGKGSGVASAYLNALQNFRGTPQYLESFLQQASPFFASTLATSPAFKDLQDYQSRSNAIMQQFGPAAGKIGAAQTQAVRQGTQQLGRMGLGQSGARSALAGQAALTAGGQQADLFTNLYQGSVQARQQMAQQAFDAQRMVATLALGQSPVPRVTQKSSTPWGAIGGAAGALLGTVLPGIGNIFGGAAGAAAGGAADYATGDQGFRGV